MTCGLQGEMPHGPNLDKGNKQPSQMGDKLAVGAFSEPTKVSVMLHAPDAQPWNSAFPPALLLGLQESSETDESHCSTSDNSEDLCLRCRGA